MINTSFHLSLVWLLCCLEAFASVIYQVVYHCARTHAHEQRNTNTLQAFTYVCWRMCMCVASHVQTSGWRQQWKNYSSWYTRACLYIEKIAQQSIVHTHTGATLQVTSEYTTTNTHTYTKITVTLSYLTCVFRIFCRIRLAIMDFQFQYSKLLIPSKAIHQVQAIGLVCCT